MAVRGNMHIDKRAIEVADFNYDVKICHRCTLVYRAIALLLKDCINPIRSLANFFWQKARFFFKNEEKQNLPSKFYLEHTFGAWIVLTIGFILASLTFIYEYFLRKNAGEGQTTPVQQIVEELENME